jgi:hypothetical protein
MNAISDRLTIEHFRGLKKLELEGLGRVNLITGRNNTGKSSILEALRLLTSDHLASTISGILSHREENIFNTTDSSHEADAEIALQISTLFNGFPQLSEPWAPMVVSATANGRKRELRLELRWFSTESSNGNEQGYEQPQPDLLGDNDRTPKLVSLTEGTQRAIPLSNLRRRPYRPPSSQADLSIAPTIPCKYVSPYGGERTATLGVLWDRIALSTLEEHVVDALRIIDPAISGGSMVGGVDPRWPRTAIVRSDKIARPVPLRSFGDGLNRLFGIALSLVNAKDGLLLIDEFENGMHYTVQLDAWKMIFRLATQLGIQVFATSHSWDAIEAFQKAAQETPEEGVLIRLARKGDDILPTIFREHELEVATRDHIEVR